MIVILESFQRVALEFRITKDDPLVVDEGHTVPESEAGRIGEIVGRRARLPLYGDETCLTRQLVHCLLDDPRVQSLVDDDDDGDDKHDDDRQHIEEEPMR